MRHQILSMVRGRTASRGGYEKAQAAGAKTKNKRIEEAAAPVQKSNSCKQNLRGRKRRAVKVANQRGPARVRKLIKIWSKRLITMAKRKRAQVPNRFRSERDSNKENQYRKTSEDYFRKLSEDTHVVCHSHNRKVSWKDELDDVCIFYRHEAPTELHEP